MKYKTDIEKAKFKLIHDIATIKEAFIIDELQSYMDLSDPSNPKWIEPVRLRLQEKEDWKRRVKEAISKHFVIGINIANGTKGKTEAHCITWDKFLKELGLNEK